MRHLGKRPGSLVFKASAFPTLIGFDEEESEEESSEDESEEESEEEESESEEESEDEDEEESEEQPKGKKNADGLKSALQKERDARKKLEKEMKDLRKFKEDKENENKTETQKVKDRADKAEKALEKATEALRDTQLDFAISGAARKARFRDIDDALRLVDRDEIEFDEDGNFDKKAVEKAVKAVKESKPHLVLSEGESGPSGSKFGGKKKNQKKATEQKLKDKYPALGR